MKFTGFNGLQIRQYIEGKDKDARAFFIGKDKIQIQYTRHYKEGDNIELPDYSAEEGK